MKVRAIKRRAQSGIIQVIRFKNEWDCWGPLHHFDSVDAALAFLDQ